MIRMMTIKMVNVVMNMLMMMYTTTSSDGDKHALDTLQSGK